MAHGVPDFRTCAWTEKVALLGGLLRCYDRVLLADDTALIRRYVHRSRYIRLHLPLSCEQNNAFRDQTYACRFERFVWYRAVSTTLILDSTCTELTSYRFWSSLVVFVAGTALICST